MKKDLHIDTLCVQSGYNPGKGEPRQVPIIQSTTFKYETSEQMGRLFDLEESGYFYTRLQNPTNDLVAAKIAAMEGVDGIFVGPFDLSIAMGLPGQFADERFQAAVKRVREACKANGKFCMSFAGNEAAVLKGYADGYDAMVYEIDAVHFISAMKARVESVKEKL